MRKTFCDNCGGELAAYHGHVSVMVNHFSTYQVEPIAVDEFDVLDLCKRCLSAPLVLLDLLKRPRRHERDGEARGVLVDSPGVDERAGVGG